MALKDDEKDDKDDSSPDSGPAATTPLPPPVEPPPTRTPGAGTRPSPAWVAGVWLASLVVVFIGERVLASTPPARWTATSIGLAGLLGMVGLRWRRVTRTKADARSTERSFALLATAGLLAVLLYFVTQEPLAGVFGISSMTPDARKRFETLAMNLWVSVILLSAVPQLFGQLALEPMRLAERVEWRRVKGAIASGLVVAMACVSATLATYAAGELGVRADFSYFRTARPSDSTVKTTQAMTQPLKVITFFPPVNEVRAEVHGYLRDLARRSKTVEIEEADRLASPKLARDLAVTTDGTIVLERGTEHQAITVPLGIVEARAKLKTLDSDFQKALVKVLKNRRVVYLTIGHGELNDTKLDEQSPGRSAAGFKELLERFNYGARDLGVAQGLATAVPDDASVVAVLGPTEPLAEQEILTLERYAARGGHVLFALEPEGRSNGERLAGMFGLKWNKDLLCDDRTFAVRRFNDSDHTIILTHRFSSHASVATLSRLGSRAVFFLGSGSLESAGGGSSFDFIARSLPSTFADKNGNFNLDSGEERTSYNLAAAIAKPVTQPGPAKEGKPEAQETRAVVIADGDALSDAALMNGSMANGNPQFLADILKWLGGEESSIGALADTGEDVKIEHTKQKDTLLFYGTIFGAPILVLALGLIYTRRVKNRMARRAAA
jgi:hypothetical protein